jgi:hypothetical protein
VFGQQQAHLLLEGRQTTRHPLGVVCGQLGTLGRDERSEPDKGGRDDQPERRLASRLVAAGNPPLR